MWILNFGKYGFPLKDCPNNVQCQYWWSSREHTGTYLMRGVVERQCANGQWWQNDACKEENCCSLLSTSEACVESPIAATVDQAHDDWSHDAAKIECRTLQPLQYKELYTCIALSIPWHSLHDKSWHSDFPPRSRPGDQIHLNKVYLYAISAVQVWTSWRGV